MRTSQLRYQAAALEQSIEDKRYSIGVLDARIEAVCQAKAHALAAMEESEALTRSVGYFALVTWAGKHAVSFSHAMQRDGSVGRNAQELSEACSDLVDQMNQRIQAMESERSSLWSEVSADERSLASTLRQIRRAGS